MKYYRLRLKDNYPQDFYVLGKIYKGEDSREDDLANIEQLSIRHPLNWDEVGYAQYLVEEGLVNDKGVDFFDTELSSTLEKIRSVLGSKAKEYSTNVDKFHNFNEGAKILGCIPEKCLDAYMTKHLVSYRDMLNRLQNGEIPSNELVDEKLGDIINYFILQKIQLKQRNNVVLPR